MPKLKEKPVSSTVATNGEVKVKVPKLFRIDLGCGPNKKRKDEGERDDWKGTDSIAFPGVDYVFDLAEPVYEYRRREIQVTNEDGSLSCEQTYLERVLVGYKPWPFKDNSVDQIHSSHVAEHLDSVERVHYMNEIFRILKVGAQAQIICPHWASCRSLGDPTHRFAPLGEFWAYYLLQSWRDTNAPHTDARHWPLGFNCDFDATWGYGLHPEVQLKNADYQQFAVSFYKESISDIAFTVTKRG